MTNTLCIAVIKGRQTKEFDREVDLFEEHWKAKNHNVTVVKLGKMRPYDARGQVLKAIRQHTGTIDRLVFFCHGTWRALKCGWNVWNVSGLAQAIAQKASKELDVVLYACSCGRARGEWPWRMTSQSYKVGAVKGTEGFAARLIEALVAAKVDARIYAHGSFGHTTRNPYCYRFSKGALSLSLWREPIVQRGTARWGTWKTELKTWRRFEIPFE